MNLTAFGVLALRAAGAGAGDRAVRRAAAALERRQNADGGFNFAGRGTQRDRRHRRRACRRSPPSAARGARSVRRAAAFLGAAPEPRRRLPAPAAAALQRPVDGVRRPGPDRRRPRVPTASARAARARRSPTCARSRPPTEASATAARARRRRFGSPRRRWPRSHGGRCRCAALRHAALRTGGARAPIG